MPRVWFEPTISAGERPQAYALDRAATGTGCLCLYSGKISKENRKCGDKQVKAEDGLGMNVGNCKKLGWKWKVFKCDLC